MQACKRCEKVFHSSELIGGMFCFDCSKKAIASTKTAAKVFRVFASFYQFTPIIAVTISLLLFILDLAWFIIILPVVMLFVCLLGAFQHMHKFMTVESLEMVEENYKEQVSKYQPGKISYCVNHPTREAISRCGICLGAFCAECFYFQHIRIPKPPFRSILYEQPAYCLKCGDQFKAGISVSPIVYTMLTLGVLILTNFLFVEGGMNIIFSLLPIFICTAALPLGFLYIKSKLYTKGPLY